MSVPWKPEEDGVTHVNLYSKSKSAAGRYMSNFAPVYDLLLDGFAFGSIEAYWYWLGLNPKTRVSDHGLSLMPLDGYRAKQVGRELQAKYGTHHEPDFLPKMKAAIRVKMQSQRAQELLLSTGDLPLTHYYVFESKRPGRPVSVVDAGHGWLPLFYQRLRTELRMGVSDQDAQGGYHFPPDSAFEPMDLPV